MSIPGAFRVAYRDLLFLRKLWKANLMATVIQPFFYLLGIGFGVGKLVDQGATSPTILNDISYLAFYATALPATTAMFSAGQFALWPTLDGFNWSNAYKAMVATPLDARDVVAGYILHLTLRTAIGATGTTIALLIFEQTRSWRLVGVLPAAVLTGLAFALPIASWASTRQSDRSFTVIVRFVLVPMFLFGGTFYPIEQLPPLLAAVAKISPLWHGIELSRDLMLTGASLTTAVHALVLVGFITGGWVLSSITFRRRLQQ